MKNESLQQLPTKTPEKMIERKNTRVNLISDHSEEESGQHKSKRIKQSRLTGREKDTNKFIQTDRGTTYALCYHIFSKSVHVKSLMN
jgi:hypothetical protein